MKTNSKSFFKSKINWVAMLSIAMSLLPLISEANFGAMNVVNWIQFGLSILIIIFRTFATTKQKAFFNSKINWAALLLIATSIFTFINEQAFGLLDVKGWIMFILGVAIIIMRVLSSGTPIVVKKKK